MSSIPYIEIDWSSTPRQPYVQLGDPTPPENDSANILHNTELTTVLSSEDIFFLDIDDIYPYTYSTLHLDDNEMEETYDDEDYFEQLLNAEIEEISCIKHDTPSISSTPLTPIQDNIPLPPPNTAPISDNLLKVRKNTTLQVSPEKFHVTTPKRSGYNEIYEIRRSKMTVLDKDIVQYENARAKLALHENPTDFKTLAPLLVKPTLPSMVYPSAKEKARLNALANDETSSPNSNQSINDLLPRQIARPRSKKKILSTDTVDNCNTPPPGPSRTTTDSPPRLIA
ncbi:8106_t:CDS:2 [Rhizophagus irregularis]|nr:8106_t:CDS:2 [Rhizophagus irregularis]